MTLCVHCGTPLRPGSLTCPNCGRLPFIAPEPKPPKLEPPRDDKPPETKSPQKGGGE